MHPSSNLDSLRRSRFRGRGRIVGEALPPQLPVPRARVVQRGLKRGEHRVRRHHVARLDVQLCQQRLQRHAARRAVGRVRVGQQRLDSGSRRREHRGRLAAQQAAQVAPRGLVAHRATDGGERVLNLAEDDLVCETRGVVDDKPPLVPRAVVAHVLLKHRVHKGELAVPLPERRQHPLPVRPRMVVLRVVVEDGARELKLARRRADALHDGASVVPNLVVLRRLRRLRRHERELRRQIEAQRVDALAPEVPGCVVGSVALDGTRAEVESARADLARLEDRAEVVHRLGELR
mmetsp:Transcript_19262/g.68039  ORF Transcript_19262/g.68039 Transcript_19262/m.68039 type:complete len:291 (-) Transcript_19262:381-1253(-)